jgi:hypothetical protein
MGYIGWQVPVAESRGTELRCVLADNLTEVACILSNTLPSSYPPTWQHLLNEIIAQAVVSSSTILEACRHVIPAMEYKMLGRQVIADIHQGLLGSQTPGPQQPHKTVLRMCPEMWTESRYRPAVMVLVYQNTMQSIRFRQSIASTH